MWKLDTERVSDTSEGGAAGWRSRRTTIADVFEKHVQRFGYRKTTLDEVARELGISKKTLYVHFDGKSAIYAYLVERIAKQARREMAAAIAALPTNAEKVMALLALVLRQSRGHIAETADGRLGAGVRDRGRRVRVGVRLAASGARRRPGSTRASSR